MTLFARIAHSALVTPELAILIMTSFATELATPNVTDERIYIRAYVCTYVYTLPRLIYKEECIVIKRCYLSRSAGSTVGYKSRVWSARSVVERQILGGDTYDIAVVRYATGRFRKRRTKADVL